MIIACAYYMRNPKSSETPSLLAYYGNLKPPPVGNSRLVLVASYPAPRRTSWLEI
jgi:hypothetical protein